MERREAQGSSPRAHAPRDPHHPRLHLGPGILARRRAPDSGPQRAPTQALWRLPALHPLGDKEKWERRAPNVSKQPAGGALAERSCAEGPKESPDREPRQTNILI